MREIRLSGSGEGAVHPVPISSTTPGPRLDIGNLVFNLRIVRSILAGLS